MLNLFYRVTTPAYQGSAQPAPANPSFLTGLWCSLFGGAIPAYRSRSDAAAPAATRCFWQAFSPSPSYKTAPATPPSEPSPTPSGSDSGPTECPCTSDGVPAVYFVE